MSSKIALQPPLTSLFPWSSAAAVTSSTVASSVSSVTTAAAATTTAAAAAAAATTTAAAVGPTFLLSNANTNATAPLFLVEPRCFLVYDTMETDGRFILYLMAQQILQSTNTITQQQQQQQLQSPHLQKQRLRRKIIQGRVLWLSCSGAWTVGLIQASMKKLGLAVPIHTTTSSTTGTASTNIHPNKNINKNPSLHIQCLAQEMEEMLRTKHEQQQQQQGQHDDDKSDWFDSEAFVRQVYRNVKEWLLAAATATATSKDNDNNSDSNEEEEWNSWVILDDVSALTALVGERLTYSLCYQLNALSLAQEQQQSQINQQQQNHHHQQQQSYVGVTSPTKATTRSFGLVIRASQDMDTANTSGSMSETIGASSSSTTTRLSSPSWERSLVELADGIVDVVPLQTGVSREAHGKLYFTTTLFGMGWCSSNNSSHQILNYALGDSALQIQAVRLSSSTLQ